MGSIKSNPVRSKVCVYTTPLKCNLNRVITWTCPITGVVWRDISLNYLKMASRERMCSLLLQKRDKNIGRAVAMLFFTPTFANALDSFSYTCLFLFEPSSCSWILCSPHCSMSLKTSPSVQLVDMIHDTREQPWNKQLQNVLSITFQLRFPGNALRQCLLVRSRWLSYLKISRP